MTHGYESYEEMRRFIEGLDNIDKVGKKDELIPLPPSIRKHNTVPIQDVTKEFIDEMIEHWVQTFSDRYADQGKKEFVIDVFGQLRTINIPEDWYPYVQSLVEWLRLSAPNQMYGNLAIFLFGYLWRLNIEEPPEEEE